MRIKVLAAMAILTLHHWDQWQAAGVAELRRVARGRVVLLTFDITLLRKMWIFTDYLPEIAEMDRRIFPGIDRLCSWLGGQVTVENVSVRADSPDWHLAAYWAHPERMLDPAARAATSGFARMPDAVIARAVAALRADLESGAWDERHGHLRGRAAYDVGLRLLVGRSFTPAQGAGCDAVA